MATENAADNRNDNPPIIGNARAAAVKLDTIKAAYAGRLDRLTADNIKGRI